MHVNVKQAAMSFSTFCRDSLVDLALLRTASQLKSTQSRLSKCMNHEGTRPTDTRTSFTRWASGDLNIQYICKSRSSPPRRRRAAIVVVLVYGIAGKSANDTDRVSQNRFRDSYTRNGLARA